jgi:hypothetical protein
VEVGPGGALTTAAPLRDLKQARPLLLGSIEVVVGRQASLAASLQKGARERIHRTKVGDVQGTPVAVQLGGPSLLAFGATVVCQRL